MSKHTITVSMSMEFCPKVDRPEHRGRLVRQYAEIKFFAPVQHGGGEYMAATSFRVNETRDLIYGGRTSNIVDGIINAIGGDPTKFKTQRGAWSSGQGCDCGTGHMTQWREWSIPQTPARMKILQVFADGVIADQETRADVEKWWVEFAKHKAEYDKRVEENQPWV